MLYLFFVAQYDCFEDSDGVTSKGKEWIPLMLIQFLLRLFKGENVSCPELISYNWSHKLNLQFLITSHFSLHIYSSHVMHYSCLQLPLVFCIWQRELLTPTGALKCLICLISSLTFTPDITSLCHTLNDACLAVNLTGTPWVLLDALVLMKGY